MRSLRLIAINGGLAGLVLGLAALPALAASTSYTDPAAGPQSFVVPAGVCSVTVDATGAGDTFGGAVLARLVAGDSLQAAARYAGVAAALSTQGYGAVEPIPTAAQVRAAMGAA